MELVGVVSNIIFRNESNGYTVLEIIDDEGQEITAVGAMPLAAAGERIELAGDWTEHPAYGPQFKASSCHTLSPATLSALVSYLASGLIKGIGDATAKRIVKAFGMDTLKVLEKEPDRLTEVEGIGQVRAGVILESFNAQRDMRDIMLALQEFGVTVNQAVKLYKMYGPLCLARIRENPYSLIDDIENIGFKTADKIAQSAGFEHDSAFRLRAGLKYVLNWARQEGHTFLPREKLIEVAVPILEAETQPVEWALNDMITDKELVFTYAGDTDAVFLPWLHFVEGDCAARLLRIAKTDPINPLFDIDYELTQLEQQLNTELAPQQRDAVLKAFKHSALVITGGPGTGKTTILRFIIQLVTKLGLDFELCAPTGRAAKRMSEATGCEARTLHRLLEFGYGSDSFNKNEENPILADVVVIDEMSMVDVLLMHSLLKAIPPGTRLIMVGDVDQLPSVGAGNVLKDIINSNIIPVSRLTEIFRQSERSMIVYNAHSINRGKMPVLNDADSDFTFEQITNAEAVLNRLVNICTLEYNSLGVGEPLMDIQVLSPMKKGILGVKNINTVLQSAINPPGRYKRECRYGDTVYREGDKVMQVKNNYRLEWIKNLGNKTIETSAGVYNGDLGTICSINNDTHTVGVIFDDGREASYDFIQLDELELAYCVSIHKSQGCEYPAVVLPLAGGPPMLMTRNLLYTAVTRARKRVHILGRLDSVSNMLKNTQQRKRYSALSFFLTDT